MPRYLVSLVGELVIPNLLLMKTFGDVDRHLFIVPKSRAKDGSVERLCALCGIGSPETIAVEEFSLSDISRAVKNFLAGKEQNSSFVVNLTAGSRIMALAAFEEFRKADSHILYLPPASNSFQQIWPEQQENYLTVTHRLDIFDYLKTFGVLAEPNRDPLHSPAQLEEMFGIMTKNSDSRFMHKVNKLGSKPDSAKASEQQAQFSAFFAKALDIPPDQVNEPEWLNFIKGAWFEEYLAYWIDRVLGTGTACHGLKVEKDGVINEIDTAFMVDNVLHVCELKSSAQFSALNDILYKLDSVGKDFGLLPKCFLVIADPDVERSLENNLHLRWRAEKMGITLITYSQLKPQNIGRTIENMAGAARGDQTNKTRSD